MATNYTTAMRRIARAAKNAGLDVLATDDEIRVRHNGASIIQAYADQGQTTVCMWDDEYPEGFGGSAKDALAYIRAVGRSAEFAS